MCSEKPGFCIINKQDSSVIFLEDVLEEMTPKELYQFPPSVILSAQHAKQQTVITTYDLYTNVLQVSIKLIEITLCQL